MRASRALLLCAALSAPCLGCGGWGATGGYLATDGNFYPDVKDDPYGLHAIKASAVRDLGCPAAQINARSVARDDYLADGCGQRAAYKVVLQPRYTKVGFTSTFTVVRVELMSRFPYTPPPP